MLTNKFIQFDQIFLDFPLQSIGFISLGGGVSGCLGVIIFAIWGNKDKWMPEHANNFFGTFYFCSFFELSLNFDFHFRLVIRCRHHRCNCLSRNGGSLLDRSRCTETKTTTVEGITGSV